MTLWRKRKTNKMQDKGNAAKGARTLVIGRADRLQEIVAVVALVASREFGYINGQLILVDGGTMRPFRFRFSDLG